MRRLVVIVLAIVAVLSFVMLIGFAGSLDQDVSTIGVTILRMVVTFIILFVDVAVLLSLIESEDSYDDER